MNIIKFKETQMVGYIRKNGKLLGLSAFIALIFLITTFFFSNQSVFFSSVKFHLQCYNIVKSALGLTERSSFDEDSVLLVNTHCSNTLVKRTVKFSETDSVDVGSSVVSRELLYHFFNDIKDKNYKYILLDIFFDARDSMSKEDKKLYNLIASMDKIVIANVPDDMNMKLADTCLVKKVGETGYMYSFLDSDFVKYRFRNNGRPSIALKMYEEITHDTASTRGLFSQNTAMLLFDECGTNIYKKDWETDDLRDLFESGSYNIDGKYIIIGDFGDIALKYFGGDFHSTYLGDAPGPVINYSAYKYLLKGHHRISLILILILFLLFWWLVFQTIKQTSFTWIYMLGYPIFWIVLFFIIYLIYDEVYDVLITSTLFYILKTIVECVRERKLIIERIKITNNKCVRLWKKVLKLK